VTVHRRVKKEKGPFARFVSLAESWNKVNHAQVMNGVLSLFIVVAFVPAASAQDATIIKKQDFVYGEPASPLHMLDVYVSPAAKNAPVMFWIHGGGWETGDKSNVAEKPRFFVERGFVFVSVNYQLLPKVEMIDIFRDVAKSFRWVHDHIAEYGGDPKRVLVGGHSAGAQLAALLCTDDHYLKAEGSRSPTSLAACRLMGIPMTCRRLSRRSRRVAGCMASRN
jgi:acetyl esterase/lipase